MITLVIGGARSGKSRYALQKASMHPGHKAYIATAQALDDEMTERIEKHRKERSDKWMTYEEPIRIASLMKGFSNKYDVILVDCLTLWLSNLLNRPQNTEDTKQIVEIDIQNFLDTVKLFKGNDRLLDSEFRHLFIVSNEVGLGIVPDNELSRIFRDLSGYLNQRVAEVANEVYLMTAGLPLRIK